MRGAVVALVALAGCGSSVAHQRSVSEMTKLLPAALEAERPKEGDPRTAHVRVWVDAGVRVQPKWKDEITDQIDYANQLLTPLLGVKLVVDSIKDWDRAGDPSAALVQLTELDKAEGAAWVIGYVTPPDTATKVLEDLGAAEPLGHHIAVRGWVEKAEAEALADKLPDLKESERGEVLAAHRRHKQTVVLIHALATTLGAIAETESTQLQHPTYSATQNQFSERNRELLQIAIDGRLAAATELATANRLIEAIEKTPWGGWIPASHDAVVTRLRVVVDAAKSGKTAAEVPAAAYDQFNRIKSLAGRSPKDALEELANLLTAYPGNAAMNQLKCEIMLLSPGVTDAGTRKACTHASQLAQGDPWPHLAVGEALAKSGDMKAARAELMLAEAKIANLPTGGPQAWRRLIDTYHHLGALTWTEDAIAKAKLEQDPIAVRVAQTRARYGVPRGTKLVTPEQEALLVGAVRDALDLVYAKKFGEAERALATAERKWPGAAGIATARCDLALGMGQIDAARAACARALAADPKESWALYLSGVLALRDASTTKTGIERLKQAIAVDPELTQAWHTLGKAYTREKNKAARDELAKAYQDKFGAPLPQ
jgi:tetratricopeptide (TPR) repeat protein